MYACIYCQEDNSISVLQQTSLKLQIPVGGTFALRQNVTFEWNIKGQLYSGVIVRIGDDEDSLIEWGNKAYKAILKPKPVSKSLSEAEIIQQLLNYTGVPKQKQLPEKRQKKQTEKALLSKEQEEEHRDRTQIKKPKVAAQPTDPNKALEQEERVRPQVNQSKAAAKPADRNKALEQLSNQIPHFPVQRQLLSDLQSQFAAPNSSWSAGHENNFGTPLSQTWALCSGSDNNTAHDTGYARMNEPPVPPPEVINFFQAMKKPHVQSYIDSFLNHYDHDQIRMPSGFGYMTETIPTFHNLDSSSGTDLDLYTATPLQSMQTPRRSPRKHFNTPQAHREPMQSAIIHFDTDAGKYADTPKLSTECSDETILHQTVQTPKRKSPRKVDTDAVQTPKRKSPRKVDTDAGKYADTPKLSTEFSDETILHQTVQTPQRKSPRKHVGSPLTQELQSPSQPKGQCDSDTGKIRLLADRDLVWVSQLELRKATVAATKKKSNAGYILMYKLLPCVFTIKELAESRGTGIGRAAPGFENRPALDAEKIEDLKKFVNRWTKKNLQQLFADKDLNSAVTERCTYARVQLKPKKGK